MTKTEPLTIYVTPKDTREGEPGNPFACLVGRALRRAFLRTHPGIDKDAEIEVSVIQNPVVQVWHKYTKGQPDVYWWVSSPALRRLIMDFDNGLPVKPGKYRLVPG